MENKNEVRLQKYLADCGVASRRKCEEYILEGRVKVNNKVVTELGTKVNVKKANVTFDGQVVSIENKKIYIILNKPKGYISASKSQFGNPSVLELLGDLGKRVFTVGRLDMDTTGALLLTNDGDFSYKLTHPKYEKNKVYIAEIIGKPTSEEMSKFMKGIVIDGKKTSPAKIRVMKEKNKNVLVEIIIHEGRNRQIKKMCEEIGHKVVSLHRQSIGNLDLGNLKEGEWRYLKKNEIEDLMKNKR